MNLRLEMDGSIRGETFRWIMNSTRLFAGTPTDRELSPLLPHLPAPFPCREILFPLDDSPPYPIHVIPDSELFLRLNSFMNREMSRAISNPAYRENLQSITLEKVSNEPFLRALTSAILRNSWVKWQKGESILYLSLIWFIREKINGEERAQEIVQTLSGLNFEGPPPFLKRLEGIRVKDPDSFTDTRARILLSILVRLELAMMGLKEIFPSSPPSPLLREFINNRIAFIEPHASISIHPAPPSIFRVKRVNITEGEFLHLHRGLFFLICDIFRRLKKGKGTGQDRYFLDHFLNEKVKEKGAKASLPPGYSKDMDKGWAGDAYILSFREDALYYLLHHRRGKEIIASAKERGENVGSSVAEVLKGSESLFEKGESMIRVVKDVIKFDLLNSILSMVELRLPAGEGGEEGSGDRMEGEAEKAPPYSLRSPEIVLKRGGRVAWLSIRVVGYPFRTFRSTVLTYPFGDGVQREEIGGDAPFTGLMEPVKEWIERAGQYGGSLQESERGGFGLIFASPLKALQWASLVHSTFKGAAEGVLRPLTPPVRNPYYSGLMTFLTKDEIAFFPSLPQGEGRGSSLGMGLARGTIFHWGSWRSPHEGFAHSNSRDPLGIFDLKVEEGGVLGQGILIEEETFTEIVREIRGSDLPWNEPEVKGGGRIKGHDIEIRNYPVAFIFEDPAAGIVCLFRRLRGEIQTPLSNRIRLVEAVPLTAGEFENFLKSEREMAERFEGDEIPEDGEPRGFEDDFTKEDEDIAGETGESGEAIEAGPRGEWMEGGAGIVERVEDEGGGEDFHLDLDLPGERGHGGGERDEGIDSMVEGLIDRADTQSEFSPPPEGVKEKTVPGEGAEGDIDEVTRRLYMSPTTVTDFKERSLFGRVDEKELSKILRTIKKDGEGEGEGGGEEGKGAVPLPEPGDLKQIFDGYVFMVKKGEGKRHVIVGKREGMKVVHGNSYQISGDEKRLADEEYLKKKVLSAFLKSMIRDRFSPRPDREFEIDEEFEVAPLDMDELLLIYGDWRSG